MGRLKTLRATVKDDRAATFVILDWARTPREGENRSESERIAAIMADAGALQQALIKSGWTSKQIEATL